MSQPPRSYNADKKASDHASGAKDGKQQAYNPKHQLSKKRVQNNKRQKMQAGLETRDMAVIILRDVLHLHKPLDDVLGHYNVTPPMSLMEPRDRAFVRALVATSLRNYGAIQYLLKQFLDKGFPRKCGKLKEILTLGITQILFLDTPDHAALSMSVDQVKANRNSSPFDRMANAVLRRAQREGLAILKRKDMALLNTPQWLQQRWVQTYGKEIATKIMTAHGQEAGLDLTIKKDPAQWAEKLDATLLPTGSLRLAHKGMITAIEGYDDGAWWIQDISASLPVKLMGDINDKSIADFCAAPGGKTAQLLASGAKVTALDSSEKRLKRLKENLHRLNFEAAIVCGDACNWQSEQPFDGIIIDAPCSATGTIRRHPDLPLLKNNKDIFDLVALQKGILKNALRQLNKGGTLIYGTCSLEPEEGEQQIKWLLEEYPELKLKPITAEEVGGCPDWITKEGYLRTLPFYLPHSDTLPETVPAGMDGFFAARLVKEG